MSHPWEVAGLRRQTVSEGQVLELVWARSRAGFRIREYMDRKGHFVKKSKETYLLCRTARPKRNIREEFCVGHWEKNIIIYHLLPPVCPLYSRSSSRQAVNN